MQRRSNPTSRLNRAHRLRRSQRAAKMKRSNRIRALLKARSFRTMPVCYHQPSIALRPIAVPGHPLPPSHPDRIVQSPTLRRDRRNTALTGPFAMGSRSTSIMDQGDDRASVASMRTADSMASFYTDPHPTSTSPRPAPLERHPSEPMSLDSDSTWYMEVEGDDMSTSTVRSRGSPTPVPMSHPSRALQPGGVPAFHFGQEILPLVRYDILREFIQHLYKNLNNEAIYSAMDTGYTHT